MKIKNSKPVSRKPFFLWLNVAICLVLLALCVCTAGAPDDKRKTKDRPVSYTVISNNVVKNAAIDYVRRNISLMIEPADFTEEKLRKLLNYLFRKYRTPHNMSVYLYSHPIQLRDSGMLEQTKPNDEARKYPSGLLSRIDGKEEISYTLPSSRGFTTIVVKERGEPKEK